jgi:hypothetical protein|nr:MAG TPA: hypothetical protein [Caudoviricetes sp.]
MSRTAYDRARAEYIKSHSRAERLRRAWILAGVFASHLGGFASKKFYGVYFYNLMMYGYDIKQVDALSESMKCGLTCPTIRKHYIFCFDTLRTIEFYEAGFYDREEAEKVIAKYMNGSNAPESNPAMVLRAAFRELEHALITLPRTTLSKKETVANATHSS